ncbi:MAG: 2-oxo-4-hydroxy-4-carboxy-5-ureidoimidazoline decarboxylase, partial [Myxococcota bacterium]
MTQRDQFEPFPKLAADPSEVRSVAERTAARRFVYAHALSHLNAMDADAIAHHFGGLYEDSQWAADAAFAKRPFESADACRAAFREAVSSASHDQRLQLIRNHPELAGEKLKS